MDFKGDGEILICTEAGGEGRNLQFANILFNYDLPWSPLKIEQRIGRIHRFGQKDNVYIFNFASKDTVAERILEVLTNKIQLFENSIGASDDLLGTIEEELDFNSSLMKFVTGQKSREELETELDMRIEVAKKGFEKLNGLVTPRLIDFNLKDYYDHTLEERKYSNEHLEEFVLQFMKSFPGSSDYHITRDLEISTANATGNVQGAHLYTIYGSDNKKKQGTFHSELALMNDSLEFLAFGHPMIETFVEHVLNSPESFRSKIISHPNYKNHIFIIYLVDMKFSLQRTEIHYISYNVNNQEVKFIEELPQEVRGLPHILDEEDEDKKETFNQAMQTIQPMLDIRIERRKDELTQETNTLFLKEEYKIQASHQKNIRQLEEKLMRQEASYKWEGKPENKAIINRTKNEILRAKEDYERELQKVRSGSKIRHTKRLFQVYFVI